MIHNFTCVRCKRTKSHESEFTTGHANSPEGKICFQCCGETLAEGMLNGKINDMLYLSKRDRQYVVTNWPGTFLIVVDSFRFSNHNMAGKNGRCDVWFSYGGHRWWGRNIGDSQIVHAKRIAS